MAFPIIAAAQAGLGLYQAQQAGKIKANRPTRRVSEESREIEATYGQLARGGVPGQQQAVEDIQRSTQNIIGQSGRYTSSSANMLAMLGQTQGMEAQALRRTETQRQQTQLGLIGQYMQAKQNVGTEKQAAWQYNVQQKFEEEAAAKSQLQGAAIENVMGGVQGFAGAAAAKDDNVDQATPTESIYGNNNKKKKFNVFDTYNQPNIA